MEENNVPELVEEVKVEVEKNCEGDSVLNKFFSYGCSIESAFLKWLFIIGCCILCAFLWPLGGRFFSVLSKIIENIFNIGKKK